MAEGTIISLRGDQLMSYSILDKPLDYPPCMKQGFLLTKHSCDRGNQTEISLWLSSSEGPVQLLITGERPLFFVCQEDQQRVAEVMTAAGLVFELRILSLRTFQQQPVAALYFLTLRSFYRAQELLKNRQIALFEGDIRLHERYLMERSALGAIEFQGQILQHQGFTQVREVKLRGTDYQPHFKVVSIDLECAPDGELYSIALYAEGVEQVLMIGEWQSGHGEITWVADEKALLHAFEHNLSALDPDLIIGWNLVNFDFRLLLRRAEIQGIRLRLGRGDHYASWRDARDESNTGFVTLPGRMVIDGIAALKTATYQFFSFSLDAVARELLERGKLSEEADNPGQVTRLASISLDFIHNKPRLAAYNLEDCRLVWDIFQHTKILPFLVFRAQLTGLELDRSGGSVAAFSNLYLPRLHRAGYIAPNLPEGGGLASPGGYVLDSAPGLYQHILVFDFKSLYPSIIRTFKIDPLGLVEGLARPEDAIEGYRGACFSRTEHLLPGIITALWEQRDQAKISADHSRSQALKILMNSFYGVLGSGGCRFYDTRLASSITLRGHDILKQTTHWIEERGLKVIYGDTDSLFVHLHGQPSNQEADDLGQELIASINQRWHAQLQEQHGIRSHLELEYETHFERFLMPTIRGSDTGSKKRYAGLIRASGGEQLIFKGLEAIRSDWTELAKIFQNELYRLIFHDQDPSAYICRIVTETRDGQRDSQLVYRKRLRRNLDLYVKNIPPQVRAARLADAHNERQGKPLKYQHRGTIAYLITSQGPEPLEYLLSPIDYEHYIDKQIRPIADAILPFVGLSFDSLTGTQMGLF
ncbi:MAG: DNA polymerase-2 [Motiliproteus sp.]|jgi:DNA polymerase-2